MRIDLRKGELLLVREAAGSTVTVHAGAVWLTEQDNPRDVELRSGQSFTLARPGLALLEAFGDAAVSVDGRWGI
jgi:hypothetical protein